ncbi:SOS response-associated peptidase family protein [Cohnella caldifontis]|uniref:SOS response-associated peptidase family protein n=1 Tax=Cohnella caldifontis TaxID=3027471 RepID=UPI0023EAB13A|nr:SOS response-associated peptidase family protein [Cohnella sp. YIM B05605]
MEERYTLSAKPADLTGTFRVDRIEFACGEKDEYEPTGQIPAIRPVGRERLLSAQRWGLMPYWGKSSLHVQRDSLGDKPYLFSMLAKKRCVIPCSGLLFARMEGKRRTVYRRKLPGKRVFGVAALYDIWLDSEKNEYPMCTLLTTSPKYAGDETTPLVLEGDALDQWLDPGFNAVPQVWGLLRSIPEADFVLETVADPLPWAVK